MKVCTITCHDVYNPGASLQAYALMTYIDSLGHDCRIIDYKPGYLGAEFSLSAVSNARFDKPVLRQLYLIAKLPRRIRNLKSPRLLAYAGFNKKYFKLTRRYKNVRALTRRPPEADVFIVGSDQVWNPLFENGKDPAFFLTFAPEGTRKVSYAASFAANRLSDDAAVTAFQTASLRSFDFISVREKTGLSLLEQMGITNGQTVLDPVFLLSAQSWRDMLSTCESAPIPQAADFPGEPYVFVCDFDVNPDLDTEVLRLRDAYGLRVYTWQPKRYADVVCRDFGPLALLSAIAGASYVVSNSFHVTALSLIFHVPFLTVNRTENLNTRMSDLLDLCHIGSRSGADDPVDWETVDACLNAARVASTDFLARALKE